MNSTTQFFFALAFLVLFHAQLTAETATVEMISQSEAEAIIQARMEAKADRDAAMRQTINAATVLQETVVKRGTQDVIVRRVAAPPASALGDEEAPKPEQAISKDIAFEFPVDPRRHETISVSAQIFDDLYSKVVWRDTETGQTFDLWTNINMVYLNPLSAFDTEHAHYNYFAMAETITQSGEEERRKAAAKMGYAYQSRWEHPPVELSDEIFEYVVVTETKAPVPEKLYEQMDALFAFYLEERDSLEASFKNAQKLRIAHEKFMQENPPEVEPSITNFWPGKNSSYQGEQP